ncbi:hypothetical protein T4A_1261 [Trichinella pseudospiralis]|uniref:Uncharacterized protein n=1 Tax=Trichinella pseudospiralis TaxID=6337 RepID=A0A0V1C4M7_TRIPS|nr:hypothetical protein T4A_1261 [Trichinella pseudospiralis]
MFENSSARLGGIPHFQSSPLPHPVAVPEACRLARSPQWDQMQGQARLDCPCAAPRPPAL